MNNTANTASQEVARLVAQGSVNPSRIAALQARADQFDAWTIIFEQFAR